MHRTYGDIPVNNFIEEIVSKPPPAIIIDQFDTSDSNNIVQDLAVQSTSLAHPLPVVQVDSPSSNDVKKHLDFLQSIGFQVDTIFKVLICSTCMYAVIPGNIPGHLKTHNISRTFLTESINSLVEHFQILIDTSIVSPSSNGPPISGLRIHDGLSCTYCNYVCLTEGTAEKHHHGKSSFIPCKAQTFFYPTSVRYFSVIVPEEIIDVNDLYGQFVRQILPTIPQLSIGTPSTVREIPPLLLKTQWHLHLKDWQLDPSKRQQIKTLVKPASPSEPWTLALAKSVETYMIEIRSKAYSVDYLVLRKLMQEPKYVSLNT